MKRLPSSTTGGMAMFRLLVAFASVLVVANCAPARARFQSKQTRGEVLAITCGSPALKDGLISDKEEWIVSPNTYTRIVGPEKLRTGRRVMCRTARYSKGASLKYAIYVGKGTYSVILYFAEIDGGSRRVVDINVNGRKVNGYDVVKEAGGLYRPDKVGFYGIQTDKIIIEISRVRRDPGLNGLLLVRKQGGVMPKPDPTRKPPTPKPAPKTPAPDPPRSTLPPRDPPRDPPKAGRFPVWTAKPNGKPQDFGKAPPPGVHPRVWFGPDRLPALRKLLLDTPSRCDDEMCHKPIADVMGAAAYLYLKMRVLTGRYNDPMMDGKSKFSELYDLLKVGKTDGKTLSLVKSLGSKIGHDQAAKGGQGYQGMYGLLAGAGFVGLIKEQPMFKHKELSTALSSMCKLHKSFYVQDNSDNFHHDAHVDLGLAYDFMASYMSEAQKKPCRELIMMMIEGRKELGQVGYLGAPWRTNWNHIGWHEHIVILALSIYGEAGTKGEPERFLNECLEVQKKWFFYGVSEAGFGREEIYYFNLGLMWAQPAQVAIARYGDKYNLVHKDPLGDERIHRQMVYHFMTKTIPGTSWQSFSGGNNPARAQIMWAYMFPNDEMAHYNVQNGYWDNFWTDSTLQVAVFAVEPMKNMTYKEVAMAKGLPLSLYCRDRGRMIARSSWDDDAMTVDFEMRTDTYRIGHVAAQPNTFYIYALGKPWIIKNDMFGDGYETSSMILIDGKGSSGHDPAVKHMSSGVWNEYKHSENGITLGSADAAYAYTYEMSCASNTKCVPNPGFKAKDFTLKTDPFYQDWMEEGVGYKLLTERNAMAYAHRTVVLVRSKPLPFTLVTDDYKKDDDDEHDFMWYVNCPVDEFQLYMKTTVDAMSEKRTEVILSDAKEMNMGAGAPRFITRLLDWEGSIEKELDFGKVTVKDAKHGKTGSLTRISLTTRGKIGHFKFFFFAYRQGDPIPETTYDRSSGVLTVKLESETRRFKYSKKKDGRTLVTEM